MNLSNATAVIRPRSAWEAMDLGCRLVQRDFLALAARWLISTTPWAILAFLMGNWLDNALWAYVLFWSMKPAFDRVPLEYLSRRLFSGDVEQTNLWHLCVRLPFSYSAWRHLSYLRLSLTRSFTLPVYQLEGQGPATRGPRLQTIASRDYGAAAWLTLTFFFVSIAAHLTISSYLLTFWRPLNPYDTPLTIFEQYLTLWDRYPGIVAYLDFFAFYLVHSVIELFYVGAGFALYLNRRTHLEAWDIELAFRRLSSRLKQAGKVLTMMLAAVLLAAPLTPTAQAQSTETDAQTNAGSAVDAYRPSSDPVVEQLRTASREQVKTIYASDAFGTLETSAKWEKKAKDDEALEEDDGATAEDAQEDAVERLVRFVVAALKYMIIALFAGLLITWVSTNRHLFFANPGKAKEQHRPQSQQVSETHKPAFMPDPDVPDTVISLWRQGEQRDAMSYLYRSALAYLTSRHALEIRESATEGEVLSLVRAQASQPVYDYFAAVTGAWRHVAYAQITPAEETVSGLCDNWPRLSEAPHEG